MALLTPSTVVEALEKASTHKLVVGVKETFLEHTQDLQESLAVTANERILLAQKTLVVFMGCLPEVTVLEQLKPWYDDLMPHVRDRTLPPVWRKKSNKSALKAVTKVLRRILHAVSPIIMVTAVAEWVGDFIDVDGAMTLEFVGKDQQTRDLAECITPIIFLGFTPDNFPHFLDEVSEMPWCTDMQDVGRWVTDLMLLAGRQSGCDMEYVNTIAEEFSIGWKHLRQTRRLLGPVGSTVQHNMVTLKVMSEAIMQYGTLLEMQYVADVVLGLREKSHDAKLDPYVEFWIKFMQLLPIGLCKQLLVTAYWPNDNNEPISLSLPPTVHAEAGVSLWMKYTLLLVDLWKEIDPALVAHWKGFNISEKMPEVE